ncbi:hypothetical protein [Flavobacterium sp.]|uniref:hypothetical protein n=1 Tax=Flavobacterium sp. TaxID=239 RepID=UPI0037539FD2
MKSKIHELRKANNFSVSNKAIIYLTLIASLTACSQKKEKPMNEITASNIVEKITKEVKHYPKEPFYYIYVANSLCVYEILINDYSIKKLFKYEQQATPIYINEAILKSGKQKITYRIYPAPKEFNSGSDVFDFETEFRVKVFVNDNATGLQIENQKLITEHNAPTKIRMTGHQKDIPLTEFEGKGQKYYEHSFYFDAEVPYNNEGWSTGQDLKKLDQKNLEKAIIDFYMKRKEIILNKNKDTFAGQVFVGLKEQFIAEYRDKEYVRDAWNEFIEVYDNTTYEFQPFENYKMEFFGDGKIVCLRQINTDPRYREKSALFGKYKDADGNTRADFHNLYLYLPQGKKLSELEMIR